MIYIVRHGETDWNLEKRNQGRREKKSAGNVKKSPGRAEKKRGRGIQPMEGPN